MKKSIYERLQIISVCLNHANIPSEYRPVKAISKKKLIGDSERLINEIIKDIHKLPQNIKDELLKES